MTTTAARIALSTLFLALTACGGGGDYTPPVNTAPTAIAGAAQQVEAGAKVSLDGAGTDPENDMLSFVWTLSKPANSFASLLNPKVQHPNFIADIAGTYTATLVANDGKLNSAPSTLTVTVSVPLTSFIKLWDGDTCSTSRQIFIIDQHFVYTRSASSKCSDSNVNILYESMPSQRLCSSGGVSGAVTCDSTKASAAAQALFSTVNSNGGRADLGLGEGHTVLSAYSVNDL